jgi:NAD(P)-dependent dehydrogenase (short-subunit alcohol dehydrogenase family)
MQTQPSIALITGAASGIGAAAARCFSERGSVVICADINLEGASNLASEILSQGFQAEAIALDVTSESAWNCAFEHIQRRYNRLDVLINNAGISFGKPLTEMSVAEWQRVMDVNLTSVMLGTKYALRLMIPQLSGSIINIASASGIKAVAGASAYCTSKAGVIMLTKAAALEAAPHHVRVNAIAPSGVATAMWESMDFFKDLTTEHGSTEAAYKALSGDTPLKRFASAHEIAEAAWYLASPTAGFMTGTVLTLDGGYTL